MELQQLYLVSVPISWRDVIQWNNTWEMLILSNSGGSMIKLVFMLSISQHATPWLYVWELLQTSDPLCFPSENHCLFHWVDNLNWPLYRVLKLMFQALALRQSKRQRADAQDISFKALYSGQFTLSTQLITLNYHVILSQPCSTTDIFFRNLPLLFFSLILLYKQCSGFAILLKFNLI